MSTDQQCVCLSVCVSVHLPVTALPPIALNAVTPRGVCVFSGK